MDTRFSAAVDARVGCLWSANDFPSRYLDGEWETEGRHFPRHMNHKVLVCVIQSPSKQTTDLSKGNDFHIGGQLM